ncbi:hypothetical protein RvY_13977 [Ramazzottius varieornatus]|uniref:Uncharacterized protein n=1 Tax=Ramazzottius varieornatus TaxID=947166 RepID=A0A1D1VRI2_RAMVA|nr:hypothetical protein RvY_13977 [Ramazzottius varieornatus]
MEEPAASHWEERASSKAPSRTVQIASALSMTAFLWLSIALCSPHWLESDNRIYSSKFDKMGIWTFCFRSFSDPKRRYPQHFVSCRWFFDSHWKYMYDILAPLFGSNAYREDWLAGWQNNYLSWSFALAVIGGLQLFIASTLYYVEAKRCRKDWRKRRRSDQYSSQDKSAITRPLAEEMDLSSAVQVLASQQLQIGPPPTVITTVLRQSMV